MTRSPSSGVDDDRGGSDDATGPDDRGSGELRMRQDHGVAANLYVLVDGDRLGQPHCDTLAHEPLPLSLPGPRFGAREVGAVIDAEGVIRLARHRGDRPRLIVLSRGDGDRDQVGQVELAGGATGADLIQRPPRPMGIERHQPGVDLGRTDALSRRHRRVARRSPPVADRRRARCGRSRRDPGRMAVRIATLAPEARTPARSLATVEGSRRGGRCRGQRAGRPPAAR